MATMDSPLEVLAFEFASFGVLAVVNNVWTWIAVVTAAVSFWKIRVTSIGDGHGCALLEELIESKSNHKSSHFDEFEPEVVTEEPAAKMEETETATEVWEPLMCDDGVTKGKLTMYYEVDVNGEKYIDGELTDVNYGGGLGNSGDWWGKWERVVKMRNGDDGWYRYVDLTVINGNVVRLWDDNRNQ